MARTRNVLTVREVEAAVKAGLPKPLKDGGGLYLMPNGKWVYFFKFRGKEKELWLGAWPTLGLAAARDQRNEAEAKKKAGVNPTDERQAEKVANRATSFAEFALENVDRLGPKKEPGRSVWLRQMTTPKFLGDFVHMTPNDIQIEHVEKALLPFWETRTATSIALRMRIRRVLSSARAKKLIAGERWINPATYRDVLEHTMPRSTYEEEPRPSLPWQDVPAFLCDLRARPEAILPMAAEWLVLTGARVDSVTGAQWGEIDLRRRTWTVPAARMKGREGKVGAFVVPLTRPMVGVLRRLLPRGQRIDPNAFLFPSPGGRSRSGHMESSSMWNIVRRVRPNVEVCPHGFRASFSTWAEEETDFGDKIISAAIGHKKKDKVQRRYGRSDLLPGRRRLMRLWAAYCAPPVIAAPGLRLAA